MSDKSYMRSKPVTESADYGCNFCKERQPEGLREIEYSRNGFQAYVLTACKACREELIFHLDDNYG